MMLPVKEKFKLSMYNVFYQDGNVEYMWNTYSDALMKLDEDGQRYIRSFIGIDDGSNEFKLLKLNGFIIYEQIDEFGRVCLLEKQNLFTSNPRELTFTIAPGMNCNYKCSYCFQSGLDISGVMTPKIANDVAQYICQELKNHPTVKELRIMWFGGEPLLYIDIIEIISLKLLEYTNQNNINYHSRITTNGRFLDSKMLALLKELSIGWVQITVDGTRDVYCISKSALPEDFDNVIENICYAAEKIGLSIRLNISGNEANEAIAITDYLLSHPNLLGKIQIYFAQVCDYSSTEEVSRQAYIQHTKNYIKWLDHITNHYGMTCTKILVPKRKTTSCGLIKVSNTCIGPRGELYKCEHRFGDDSMIMGNIWNGRFFNNAELAYSFTIDTLFKCTRCEYVPVCMSICADDSIIGFVRIDCETYKHLQFKLKLLEAGVRI